MSYSPHLPAAAALLRQWGIKVAIHPSAATNGRPSDFAPIGVVAHHTASNKNSNEAANRNLIITGRSDVTGPLAQFFIARDASIHLITYGRANHAGLGGPWRGIPLNSGNRYLVGVEVDNDGLNEPYPPAQLQAARLVYAALLIAMKRDATWLLGHKEWAPGRKPDPKLDMDKLRDEVAAIITEKTKPKAPVEPKPAAITYTVKKGDTLWDIALDFKTSVDAIRKLNGIKDVENINIGQTIRIPGVKTYVVKAGDTLSAIATRNKTSVATLTKLNNLKDPDSLTVGQKIRIP